MSETDLTKKPDANFGDAAHTATKMLISLVPYVGGPAAELFAAIITPPLTRRRDEWVEAIAENLRELHEKVEHFNIEDLPKNEMFITTLMHASQTAIRNHQIEKLEALRSAVMNAALPNPPDEDVQLMFLEFIDTLTPWHLRILKFFENPLEWGRSHEISFPDWYMGGANAPLEHAFPELKGRREFYDLVVKDLYSRGLMNVDSLHVMMTASGMFSSRTTDFGKRFIKFISSPIAGLDVPKKIQSQEKVL